MNSEENAKKEETSSPSPENNESKVVLVGLRELIAHEKVGILHAFFILFKMILSGRFKVPLLVDSKTKTILDGHHRSYAAHRLGLKNVPCYCVDYLADPSVEVRSRKSDIPVDKKRVIEMALSEKVFPRKTSRHEYKIPNFKPLILKDLWK